MAQKGSKKTKSVTPQVDVHYTRYKKRKSLNNQPDMISDLPKDVLYRIIERLPLRDAARMSILSHKWQKIWASTPHLAFDTHFFTRVLKKKVPEAHEFLEIASKILFQHDGPIPKLSLWVPELKSCPDVTHWIAFLSRTGLREFDLCNKYRTPLKLSPHLFSCKDLEKLMLYRCIFSLPLNFKGFPKLTSLKLYGINIVYNTLKHLIGSCPLLQNLVLKDFSGMENKHIIVDAPNLRNLVIDGVFGSLDVKVPEDLVSASFVLQKLTINRREEESSYDLINALANSSRLEWLCLGGHICKVLFESCSLPNTCQKLKNLELQSLHLDDLNDFSSAVSCLQSFPNIETLNISVNTSKSLDEHVLVYNPDCTLHHLRCAKIGICSGSSTELKLIEFLLDCSPVLEKLYISLTMPLKQSRHSRMTSQLNRFRRASRKVEVVCPERKVYPKVPVSVSFPSSSSAQHITIDSSSSDDTYYL
ncbi:F-box/FBD/LRR-repeat protein At1g13570-like isoform X2 [Spinacia oleracea]|nr:F-box/FBD/LRR-repeat protein At1g13570-like isoform X2 [Spinacia oleracea]